VKKHDTISKENLIYAFAHTETWLEDYAKSNKIPEYELTERVAILLLTQGEGIKYNLSPLRRNSAKMDKTVVKMEMAKRTYRKTSRKSPRKGLKNKKLQSYWNNMTPEQRSKEMIRRRKIGEERKTL
jgi:hypothetical protein